jgi:gluconokinase
MDAPSVIVLMGVAGAGKTTVGSALAAALDWSFYDADDFHPPENVARMRGGLALTDEDRAPWLAALRELLADVLARGGHAVLACSALRQAYRAALVPAGTPAPAVRFVYLHVDAHLLGERLRNRRGHFAPAALLESQLATLEEPTGPDQAIWVDGAAAPEAIIARVRQLLGV